MSSLSISRPLSARAVALKFSPRPHNILQRIAIYDLIRTRFGRIESARNLQLNRDSPKGNQAILILSDEAAATRLVTGSPLKCRLHIGGGYGGDEVLSAEWVKVTEDERAALVSRFSEDRRSFEEEMAALSAEDEVGDFAEGEGEEVEQPPSAVKIEGPADYSDYGELATDLGQTGLGAQRANGGSEADAVPWWLQESDGKQRAMGKSPLEFEDDSSIGRQMLMQVFGGLVEQEARSRYSSTDRVSAATKDLAAAEDGASSSDPADTAGGRSDSEDLSNLETQAEHNIAQSSLAAPQSSADRNSSDARNTPRDESQVHRPSTKTTHHNTKLGQEPQSASRPSRKASPGGDLSTKRSTNAVDGRRRSRTARQSKTDTLPPNAEAPHEADSSPTTPPSPMPTRSSPPTPTTIPHSAQSSSTRPAHSPKPTSGRRRLSTTRPASLRPHVRLPQILDFVLYTNFSRRNLRTSIETNPDWGRFSPSLQVPGSKFLATRVPLRGLADIDLRKPSRHRWLFVEARRQIDTEEGVMARWERVRAEKARRQTQGEQEELL